MSRSSFMEVDADHHSSYFAHPASSKAQLLQRRTLVAPVTAVSIIPECNRVVIAKGSQIESHPIYSQPPVSSNEANVYRHRAFAASDGSGVIHGIRYAKPYRQPAGTSNNLTSNSCGSSTCASAVNDDGEDQEGVSDDREHVSPRTLPHWSRVMALFGGRKLAIISGGGIGTKSIIERSTAESKDDPFISLYFTACDGSDDNDNSGTAWSDGIDNEPHISSCLTLSDLVYDVRLLSLSTDHSTGSDATNSDSDPSDTAGFLAAVGLAQNAVEIWAFDNELSQSMILMRPNRTRKIICQARCITYSLSFYGWGGGKWGLGDSKYHNGEDPDSSSNTTSACLSNEVAHLDLAIAAGTPSSIIYLWSAITRDEGNSMVAREQPGEGGSLTIVQKSVSHSLPGHDGVVFSVRFGHNGILLASTGDDRTVRLHRRRYRDAVLNKNEERPSQILTSFEMSEDARLITEEGFVYEHISTAYGHTARIWDCAFSISNDMVLTCGEDSTVRAWQHHKQLSPDQQELEQVSTLHGFACLNVWCIDVDADEGLLCCGGNDGSAKIWNLKRDILMNNVESNGSEDRDEIARGLESYYLLPKQTEDDLTCPKQKQETEPSSSACDNTDMEMRENERSSSTQVVCFSKHPIKKKRKKKTQNSAHSVIGFEFLPSRKSDFELLVARRSGQLQTLDVASGRWKSTIDWAAASNASSIKNTEATGEADVGIGLSIDPSTGSCIAIRPGHDFVAIATTKGTVTIVPLAPVEYHYHRVSFSTMPYHAIQGMRWVDAHSLVTMHIKGICVWWQFDASACAFPSSLPYIRAVFNMGSVGVPMSMAYDNDKARLVIGDSRGNIALFHVPGDMPSDTEVAPIELVRKVHAKEHVNALLFSNDKIISAGNDGCIVECIISSSNNESSRMRKALSIPISAITGITRLWRDERNGNLIVGGYLGNSFVVWNLSQHRQLLKIDTGGRQRRTAFHANIFCGLSHHMAVCVGRQDCTVEFLIHRSEPSKSVLVSSLDRCLGIPCHGEFVNSVCWLSFEGLGRRKILLSGSNDSSCKLSLFINDDLVASKALPNHISCVRAVDASQHTTGTSESALLVTCGAKLDTFFYLIEDAKSAMSMKHFDPKVTLLCRNRIVGNISMDHRMNAVKAIPLVSPSDNALPHHLVLAGDSNGGLHVFIISESKDQPTTTVAHMLTTDSRPILCIDVIRASDHHIIAVAGDTSGKVAVWKLPGLILVDSNDGSFNLSDQLPLSPLFIIEAHQCGCNCISAVLISSPDAPATNDFKDDARRVLAICSGGDDEALSLWSASLNDIFSSSITEPRCDEHALSHHASSSALKGIKILGSEASGGCRVYACGYDQRVALWELSVLSNACTLNYIFSLPVDISDVNCLDAGNTIEGLPSEKVIVGGEGLEVLSFNPNLLLAAKTLAKANHLMISCGAGMSVDSGLATYEDMPDQYRDLCDPIMLVKDAPRFQLFWRQFEKQYRSVNPHQGYSILNRWCGMGELENLKSFWVYTSNVDALFGSRYEAFRDRVCEIHGRMEWRCADQIGIYQGTNRSGEDWNEWNNNRRTNERCASATFCLDGNVSGENITCRFCHRPARPNVLMFHDTDENVLKDIAFQRELYQAWEASVEDSVIDGEHLVILEIGCGRTVPAVREESEEVLGDCVQLLERSDKGGSVKLIRINLTKDLDLQYQSNTISIKGTAEESLSQIDLCLKSLQ